MFKIRYFVITFILYQIVIGFSLLETAMNSIIMR